MFNIDFLTHATVESILFKVKLESEKMMSSFL